MTPLSADARPPRLPFSSTFVIAASRVLTWGEKAVWLELWKLDRGPEGAWISDRSLADVLGLDEGTVKNYRFGLRRRGLALTVPRPGCRQVGWVMRLPAEATPRGKGVIWGRRAIELAGVLDGYLKPPNERNAGVAQDRNTGVADLGNAGIAKDRNAQVARTSREGGRGESPTSASVSEAQLLPPQGSNEEGVFADANRRRWETRAREAERVGQILARTLPPPRDPDPAA